MQKLDLTYNTISMSKFASDDNSEIHYNKLMRPRLVETKDSNSIKRTVPHAQPTVVVGVNYNKWILD
jgi:hypothetical protein